MTNIKFGTDGWRGIIADDFTYDNVRRVAAAIAAYVLKHEDPGRGLIVGELDRNARAGENLSGSTRYPLRRKASVVADDYAASRIFVFQDVSGDRSRHAAHVVVGEVIGDYAAPTVGAKFYFCHTQVQSF